MTDQTTRTGAPAHEALRRDPTGRPAATTRRRMAWATLGVAGVVLTSGAWLGGDGAVRIAAIWASVALSAIGIATYAMSRAALDRTIANLIERLPR